MNVYGPGQYNLINRLQPVDKDRNEDDNRDEKRRRKVLHQGRSWCETEEDLPIQPALPTEEKAKKSPAKGVCADQVLLERAQCFFEQLITLEDKVAQLCVYETDAFYDQERQLEVECLIQTGNIGGILFTKGEYKRQSYLIEHYQSFAKTPLLIGNDFLHGLSFYFQGSQLSSLPKNYLDERHLSDLGKAVMVQNRRMGVHFQFDDRRSKTVDLPFTLNEPRRRAFCKGIRYAHGIVAKEKPVEKTGEKEISINSSSKGSLSFGSMVAPLIGVEHVKDTIGVKTLSFVDFSSLNDLEGALISAFQTPCDAFLFGCNIAQGIEAIVQAVRSGKIREEELERRVMRILLVKAAFFPFTKK